MALLTTGSTKTAAPLPNNVKNRVRPYQAPPRLATGILGVCIAIVAAGTVSGCTTAQSGNTISSTPSERTSLPRCARSSPHNACHRLLTIAASAHPPQLDTSHGVLFTVKTSGLMIQNAGTPTADTFTTHTEHAALVRPDSSATLMDSSQTTARPATKQDLRVWRRLGSPLVGASHPVPRIANLPSGTYNFAPQGATLTYSDVAGLPTSPTILRRRLLFDLVGSSDGSVSADASLMQYGYLLAMGPLTPHERRALLRVVATVPRLETCDASYPKPVQGLLKICAPGPSTDTELTVATTTGVVCDIDQRLTARSVLYPHIRPGVVVNSVDVSLQNTTSGCPK